MKRIVMNILVAACIMCGVTAIAGATPASRGGQPIPKIMGTDDGGTPSGQPPVVQDQQVTPPPSPDPPAISIVGPAIESSYPFGTTVNFSGSFSDDGGTHTAVWTIDGQTVAGVVNESTGTVTGAWSPIMPGYFYVSLTITDQAGNSVTASTVVVIFDRGDGFMNGQGRFNSPAGALVANPQATGRVDFTFDTRYRKDDLVPTGTTSFSFNAGNMNFASSGQGWFVVGPARGMYRGTGTINGAGAYKFLLSGVDGDDIGAGVVDKVRLKITNAATGAVVYDNQMGAPDTAMATTPITSGGIEVRLPNGGLGHLSAFQPALEPAAPGRLSTFGLAQNSPNPFRASTEVMFTLPQRSHLKLAVFDVAGREIATLASGAWDAGSHTVRWSGRTDSGDAARRGVYFVHMAAGLGSGEQRFTSVRKMIVLD